jgi:hypothetical protein
LERAHREFQPFSCLAVAQPLEVAEYDRGPKSIRQPHYLLVEQPALLVELQSEAVPWLAVRFGCFGCRALYCTSSRRRGARVQGGSVGNRVQPRSERVPDAQRTGLLNKHKEGRLERVFGVVCVARERLANVPDHWPMTLDQGRKCELRLSTACLAACGVISFDDLTVRQSAQHADAVKCAKIAQERG